MERLMTFTRKSHVFKIEIYFFSYVVLSTVYTHKTFSFNGPHLPLLTPSSYHCPPWRALLSQTSRCRPSLSWWARGRWIRCPSQAARQGESASSFVWLPRWSVPPQNLASRNGRSSPCWTDQSGELDWRPDVICAFMCVQVWCHTRTSNLDRVTPTRTLSFNNENL